MKKKINRRDRKFWAGVSPWFIIGAVVIIVPIFVVLTLQSYKQTKGIHHPALG